MPEPRRLRILLADDHVTVRHGLKLLVEGQDDMEVAEASDGAAAVRLAMECRPDIIVMDVSMPGMNGLVATQTLRKMLPSAAIVTLTRHADDAYLQELLRAGASAYVLKQSPPTELLQAIRATGAGGQYVDSSLTARVTAGFLGREGRTGGRGTTAITEREAEVLRLIASGYSNKEIAQQLDLSVKTVEAHKANAMRKLDLNSRIDIVDTPSCRVGSTTHREIPLPPRIGLPDCAGRGRGLQSPHRAVQPEQRRLSMEPSSKSAEATRAATVRDDRGPKRPEGAQVDSRAARWPGPGRRGACGSSSSTGSTCSSWGRTTSCSRWSTRCRPAFISRSEPGHPANAGCFHAERTGTMVLNDVGALGLQDRIQLLEWLGTASGRTQVVSTTLAAAAASPVRQVHRHAVLPAEHGLRGRDLVAPAAASSALRRGAGVPDSRRLRTA